ncbi:hypothetical protein V8F06_011268 [Rhypophila decipiens]
MRSPPSAASFEDGQMQVFAIAKNFTIQYRNYTEAKWSDDWAVVPGGLWWSQPYTKVCSKAGLEIYLRGPDSSVYRNRFRAPQGAWYDWEQHDWGFFFFRSYGKWGAWTNIGGDFRGYLAMASRNSEEFLTFGIKIVDLGEQAFQSVPVPLVMSPNRVDVLAIGTDDRLKHRTLIGQTWSPKGWQDLGGAFNSTPAVVWLAKDKVSVYGLGVKQECVSWQLNCGWRLDVG